MTRALVTPVPPWTESVERARSEKPRHHRDPLDRSTEVLIVPGPERVDRVHRAGACPGVEATIDPAPPTDAELWFG